VSLDDDQLCRPSVVVTVVGSRGGRRKGRGRFGGGLSPLIGYYTYYKGYESGGTSPVTAVVSMGRRNT
jgi:hypothetical protein